MRYAWEKPGPPVPLLRASLPSVEIGPDRPDLNYYGCTIPTILGVSTKVPYRPSNNHARHGERVRTIRGAGRRRLGPAGAASAAHLSRDRARSGKNRRRARTWPNTWEYAS